MPTGSRKIPDIITEFIEVFVLIIVVCLWTIIGFIFWVPFLSRMIAIFSSGILINNLTDQSSEQNNQLYQQLDKGVRFYIDGYKMIFEGFQTSKHKSISKSHVKPSISISKLLPIKKVIFEVFVTIVFWSSIFGFWVVFFTL